ncbi:MAG TPA: DUF2752 domain-containing protein [Micromonosporaceae bacterium]|nr:DUF2752 domain-containing protein [Micromonosporaceae bacterium]
MPAPTRIERVGASVARVAERMPRWVGPAAAGLGVAAAVGYTFLVQPTTSAPTCLVRLLTGFDCPGCGGTRAAWYLLHGDLPAAARHHAPFVFSVPFLIYMYVAWSLRSVVGWRVPYLRLSTRTLLVFLAAWMAFSVLRNLPFAPFTWFYV